MGLESLNVRGSQTLPFFLIVRTNINKAIHRRVVQSLNGSAGTLHEPEPCNFVWDVHAIYSNCFLLESVVLLEVVACVMERKSSNNEPSAGPRLQVVKLTATDVPGAELAEPLDIHGIPALRRWLLCRGIKAATSWRKAQLIKR